MAKQKKRQRPATWNQRDEWLTANGYSSYGAYVKSSRWNRRRRAYYESYPKRCWVCEHLKGIVLHHRSYGKIGREPDEDLIPLCKRCHTLAHARGNLGDGVIYLRTGRDKYGEVWLDRQYKKILRRREARAKSRAKLLARRQSAQSRQVGRVPKRVTVKTVDAMGEEERSRYALERKPQVQTIGEWCSYRRERLG